MGSRGFVRDSDSGGDNTATCGVRQSFVLYTRVYAHTQALLSKTAAALKSKQTACPHFCSRTDDDTRGDDAHAIVPSGHATVLSTTTIQKWQYTHRFTSHNEI